MATTRTKSAASIWSCIHRSQPWGGDSTYLARWASHLGLEELYRRAVDDAGRGRPGS